MRPGGFHEVQAELRRNGGDQPAQVHETDALDAEDTRQVKIFRAKQPARLPGAVVPDARAADAAAAVGDVDLVPQAPGTALRKFRAFGRHPAGTEVAADERRERMPLDKGREHFDRHPEGGHDGSDIGFRTGRLESKTAAEVCRLPGSRGQADAHAGRH